MADRELSVAINLAQEAGALLLEHWHNRVALSASTKRAGDFVSQADRAAENHLRASLLHAFPEDGWLGEETGAREAGTRRWIVDPLDGTTNFLRGLGHWAVSVALEENGVLTLGVVHDPLRNETFSAQIDKGAHLNGTSIDVSQTSLMSNALFGTGVPFGDMAHIPDHASDIANLMPHCAGMRRIGAAALDLAYVAAGRLDGFWERRLQPWDIAAGLVLLREAGAQVEGWSVDERPEDSGTVIAATPQLFPTFATILRTGSPGT